MLEKESQRPENERIDFVSIVTPNHVHYPVAKAFAEAGFQRHLRQTARPYQRAGERPRQDCGRHGRRVRGHLQLHRLPDDSPGALHGAKRRVGRVAQSYRRVQPGLAGDAARGNRRETSRLAHRPGSVGRSRGHRRHRLARRELSRHGNGVGTEPHLRRPDDVRGRAGNSTTTGICCSVSRAGPRACSSPRKSRSAWRTTCACACSAKRAVCPGIRKTQTISFMTLWTSRARCSRAAAITCVRLQKRHHACRLDIPRLFSRRLRTSTWALLRRCVLEKRGASPRATSRPFTTARGVSTLSKKLFRAPNPSKSGTEAKWRKP